MGCTCGQRQYRDEEQVLQQLENTLGYSQLECGTIDMIFRKYSKGQVLNKNQFELAAAQLNINAHNYGYHSRICQFYSYLQSGGFYELKFLLLLGIYLSKSESSAKAKSLFEIYDVNSYHELQQHTLADALRDICSLCIDKVDNLLNMNDSFQSADCKKYLYQCSSVREKVIQSIVKFLVGVDNKISKDEFISKMSQFQNGDLLTTKGIRTCLYSYVSRLRANKRLVNAQYQSKFSNLQDDTGKSIGECEPPLCLYLSLVQQENID